MHFKAQGTFGFTGAGLNKSGKQPRKWSPLKYTTRSRRRRRIQKHQGVVDGFNVIIGGDLKPKTVPFAAV